MNLLITGGCGFLGSNLAAHGLKLGYKVTILDNLSRPGVDSNLSWLLRSGALQFENGDIRNCECVSDLVKRTNPDVVFHLAGQVTMTHSILNPRVDFEINSIGTINLLESIRLFSPTTALIFSSTNKVYGELTQFTYRENVTRYDCLEMPTGFGEDLPLDFQSPYGCSKGSAESYVLDYYRTFGLRTAVFRHSSMYGGRQFATLDQGWVGWFCLLAARAALKGHSRMFEISGNGKQVRDLLHAEDMTKLYFSAAFAIDKIKGHAFNIGGGIDNSLSLIELFAVLEDLAKLKIDFHTLPPRAHDQKFFVADTTKASRLISWRPAVSVLSGLESMYSWTLEMLRSGHIPLDS